MFPRIIVVGCAALVQPTFGMDGVGTRAPAPLRKKSSIGKILSIVGRRLSFSESPPAHFENLQGLIRKLVIEEGAVEAEEGAAADDASGGTGAVEEPMHYNLDNTVFNPQKVCGQPTQSYVMVVALAGFANHVVVVGVDRFEKGTLRYFTIGLVSCREEGEGITKQLFRAVQGVIGDGKMVFCDPSQTNSGENARISNHSVLQPISKDQRRSLVMATRAMARQFEAGNFRYGVVRSHVNKSNTYISATLQLRWVAEIRFESNPV